ncbi:HNH endonuclease, partial [Georgenia sp. 10Sc9-8]|nr:HNH endonuclease [Georgenia halotolerans]
MQALTDPDVGEEFLLGQARVLDAGRFDTLVKNWALRADPDAADRRWKDEADREELTLARTTDGWHGTLWLTPA